MAADIATIADLADDDTLWDMAKRSIISAWKNGCILWVMNEQKWTRAIGELVEWMVYHDLWSKMQVFGDMFRGGDNNINDSKNNGPKNMLDSLPDTFNEAQLEALRVSMDKPKDAKNLLRVWKNRGFIEYSAQTGLYSKTKKYLNR